MPFPYATLGANDLAAARTFYASLMDALGGSIEPEVPDRAFCCVLPGGGNLWITRPFDGGPASAGNGVTLALAAFAPDDVDAAHAAGLAAGGRDEGAPGPRPHYGPDVHIGYLRDPDGNKLSIVHYREAAATAD